METALITLILFGGMAFLLLFGVPTVFALGGIAIILTLLVRGPVALFTLATTVYSQITSETLLAIPMFTLMANFLVHSGIAERLFKALSYWLSPVRGSLAVVSVGACTALAMCGGFGPGIITMSLVAIPPMLKLRYNKSLTVGSVMAGGVLGDIIPPSIIMIVFAFITRLPIGDLFMAGVIPGFLAVVSFSLYILVRCYFNHDLAPKLEEVVTWSMRWKSLKEVILPTLLIIMVLGSIFFGIATPTESAGIGAMGAMLCAIINRTISWKMIKESCIETFKINGMVVWLLIAAQIYGVFFVSIGARNMIIDIVTNISVNPWAVIIGMQIILLILGMFIDDWAIILIVAPIFHPIAVSLGFDPIWFAIVFILNMLIAYLTPPFGWALILAKGLAPSEIKTVDIWRAAPPFVVIFLLILIAVMLFPQLVLWLPSLM